MTLKGWYPLNKETKENKHIFPKSRELHKKKIPVELNIDRQVTGY